VEKTVLYRVKFLWLDAGVLLSGFKSYLTFSACAHRDRSDFTGLKELEAAFVHIYHACSFRREDGGTAEQYKQAQAKSGERD